MTTNAAENFQVLEAPRLSPIRARVQRSRGALFLSYTCAIFFLFILNGICSEKLFLVPGFQPFGWFLTLLQFSCYVFLSASSAKIRNKSWTQRAPTKVFAAVAFFTVAATGLSNVSVGYLNYPTQLVFKSCKIIPVMIGGIFIQGKRYGWLDFLAALSMSTGLVFFSLADTHVSPRFQLKGIILVCLALAGDAVIGNLQERVMREYKISTDEMIFRSYRLGVMYILIGVTLSGELLAATKFCLSKPWDTLPTIAIFSVTAYFGVNVILRLITTFGAVVTVTVTTCRKAVTICLSFLLFSKPFTMQYLWSGLLVAFGVYLSVYAKNRSSIDANVLSVARRTVRRLKSCLQKSSKDHQAVIFV